MSPVKELLERIYALQVKVNLEGARLVVSGPKGALTEELRVQLRLLRPQIVEALSTLPEHRVRGPAAAEAIHTASILLAVAYSRLVSLSRVGGPQPIEPRLDSPVEQSVHGS